MGIFASAGETVAEAFANLAETPEPIVAKAEEAIGNASQGLACASARINAEINEVIDLERTNYWQLQSREDPAELMNLTRPELAKPACQAIKDATAAKGRKT